MLNKVKDLLLPTEMASFLRACGKYDLSISAFQVTFTVQPSPYAPEVHEAVVCIKHKKTHVEKNYSRHVSPAWTTLFDLDLLSGNFDGGSANLGFQPARKRMAVTTLSLGGHYR
jgi:hypothetical protein